MSDDLFAPAGGWRVRIRDLSGCADTNMVEEIGGFLTMAHANTFAQRYVRDQIERCRAPGLEANDVIATWMAFGEDAEVLDAGEQGWRSASAVSLFAAEPADAEDRNWRALDPRREEA